MSEPTDVLIKPSQRAYAESGAAIQRSGFGETALEQRREIAATALAARARAEIQARFIVAMERPRNVDEFRARMLHHCKRPRFASVAEYAKPVGKGTVKGPSIRFVEAAIQEFTNAGPGVTVIYDDDDKRGIRVSVTDYERNVTYDEEIVISKTVERRDARGAEVMGTRTNTFGDIVYIVRASDDDVATKQAAMVSKRIRTLGLRVLPPDIVDECMERCRQTRRDEHAADPDATRKQIVDAFAALSILPRSLDEFLGHPFAEASPSELDDLRVAFATIREGEARWSDLVDAKRAERGEVEQPSKAAEAAAASAAKVRERLAKRQPIPRSDEGDKA